MRMWPRVVQENAPSTHTKDPQAQVLLELPEEFYQGLLRPSLSLWPLYLLLLLSN